MHPRDDFCGDDGYGDFYINYANQHGLVATDPKFGDVKDARRRFLLPINP